MCESESLFQNIQDLSNLFDHLLRVMIHFLFFVSYVGRKVLNWKKEKLLPGATKGV